MLLQPFTSYPIISFSHSLRSALTAFMPFSSIPFDMGITGIYIAGYSAPYLSRFLPDFRLTASCHPPIRKIFLFSRFSAWQTYIPLIYYKSYKVNRGVAQLGRALRSGRRGRRFESCHLDQFKRHVSVGYVSLFSIGCYFVGFRVAERENTGKVFPLQLFDFLDVDFHLFRARSLHVIGNMTVYIQGGRRCMMPMVFLYRFHIVPRLRRGSGIGMLLRYSKFFNF